VGRAEGGSWRVHQGSGQSKLDGSGKHSTSETNGTTFVCKPYQWGDESVSLFHFQKLKAMGLEVWLTSWVLYYFFVAEVDTEYKAL
jgi:hypothetical protein